MNQQPDATNEFSGEARTVVQAGTVHGDIHLPGGRRSLPLPRQLPMGPSGFVNRDPGLRALDDLLLAATADGDGRKPAVVISAVAGAPGVGKTALALHWAHRVRNQFPDGDLYIDMQGYGPSMALTPARALDAFLRALGTPADSIPDSMEDRASLFRSLLNGKRILVLIDNVSSSSQVRHLIPASYDCFTVVTSRSALPGLVARDGAARVTLDVLSPEESVELLSEVMGHSRVAMEPLMASRIAELCGYLPLALRIVGERASNRPRLSLTELVDEIVSEQQRLDALASDEDELSDTRAVFSWSYQSLTPELQISFRRLGLHAGPEISVGVGGALIGTDSAVAKRQLRALADVHLAQETFANRFRLHDLLRSYSVERAIADETQEQRTQTIRRALIWYLFAADNGRRAILPYSAAVPLVPTLGIEIPDDFSSGLEAMRWFETERLNLLAALRQATEFGQFDIAWKLAICTGGFFELGSYWSDWEESVEAGLFAARTLGDEFGEAASSLVLADAAWRAGRPEVAGEHYLHAARIARNLSIGWIEGYALRGLGLLQVERGEAAQAQIHFEAALRVFRSSGPRRGEGMSLLSLGECARMLHDRPLAVANGLQAIAIFEEIGDIWTVAWGRLHLAASLADSDRSSEALTQLHQAIEVFKEFEDRRSEALSLVQLGHTFRMVGELSETRTHWSQAAELYEALGDPQALKIRERLEEIEADG